LPPIDSCEWWPSASDPQPTTIPAGNGRFSAAVPRSTRGYAVPSHRERTDRVRSAVRSCREDPRGQNLFWAAEGGPRCGRERLRARRANSRAGACRASLTGAFSRQVAPDVPARPRTFPRRGLVLRYQSWTRPRRAPAPRRATVVFASLVRRGRKPTPEDAPWRHQSRSSSPVCKAAR
jgi:hypothetical protein